MIHSPNAAPLLVSTFIFVAKLSFNFNYNLVESWDSINFIFNTHPTTFKENYEKIIFFSDFNFI